MNTMIAVIFAAIGVGLFAERLGRRRETLLAACIGTALMLIYFFRPMNMT